MENPERIDFIYIKYKPVTTTHKTWEGLRYKSVGI